MNMMDDWSEVPLTVHPQNEFGEKVWRIIWALASRDDLTDEMRDRGCEALRAVWNEANPEMAAEYGDLSDEDLIDAFRELRELGVISEEGARAFIG